jgi:hypothetical protein
MFLQGLSDPAETRDLCRVALEARKRTPDPKHPDALLSMENPVPDMDDLGGSATALDMPARAPVTGTRALGPDNPSAAVISVILGRARGRQDNSGKAAICLMGYWRLAPLLFAEACRAGPLPPGRPSRALACAARRSSLPPPLPAPRASETFRRARLRRAPQQLKCHLHENHA